jgi:hypothetical protein
MPTPMNLPPHKKNINDNTQAYFPFAYSLTMRQAGLNSGLRICKIASNTRTATDVPIANNELVDEI